MDLRTMLGNDLRKITGVEAINRDLIEVPPDTALGDYSMPCFRLAKAMRKAPAMIANDIKAAYDTCEDKPAYIDSVEAVNGYLNIRISKSQFVRDIIGEVLDKTPVAKRGETVVLDYSSPNIAKPFHIGHLCSTIIGDSLSKIYGALGYDTVRINYLGDYGTQFGKLISAYKRWGNEEALQSDPIGELFRIYVKFHDEAEKDPAIEAEGRMYFKRLEDGEAEEVALWQRFKDLSLVKYNEIYKRLDVSFDTFSGESYFADRKKLNPVVEEIEAKGLLVESDGAKVIDLAEYNMPPCIILKSDGATIYATRDITAAKWRQEHYNFVKCLYVVGLPQALHFAQVFKSLELMGHEWSKGCEHVGFAHVRFAEGKMSTRTGHVVLLEDVLDESVKRVREKMNTDYIDADKVDYTAEKVGIGAIKFAFLKASRERDILFDWDETLDFNGESGPYVQYSYARAQSILKKASGTAAVSFDDIGEEEFELTKLLNKYYDAEAADRNEPSVVSKYAYTVAKAFNKFYNACQVIGSEHEGRLLKLVEAAGCTIGRCLGLLGMEALDQM